MTTARPEPGLVRDLYDLMTGDEDARVCLDIPDAACREQPRNFMIHVASLTATKSGDWFASPKLVLAWLLTQLGAPAFMLGLLVPVRESLSLIPQLFVARYIREVAVRKWFWVAGSLLQGLAVGAMALVAISLRGEAAGWSILGLLVIFSLARGVCSVASKDVLGKTIARTRRGAVNGYAASAAGAVIVAAGVAAGIGGTLPEGGGHGPGFFAAVLAAAALLWLFAALLFSRLAEYAGATEGGGNAIREAISQLALMIEDRQLRNFVIVRTLLLSTALVAPFYVSLANEHADGALSGLGALMIAAGAASFVSAPVWGRYADRSSRTVMTVAATLAAVTGMLTFAVSTAADTGIAAYWYPPAYFLLCVAHDGVRLGRKTYLIDMATPGNRASYVAVSNTIIGVALIFGGAAGSAAAMTGAGGAILILSLVAVAAAIAAWQLDEAQ